MARKKHTGKRTQAKRKATAMYVSMHPDGGGIYMLPGRDDSGEFVLVSHSDGDADVKLYLDELHVLLEVASSTAGTAPVVLKPTLEKVVPLKTKRAARVERPNK